MSDLPDRLIHFRCSHCHRGLKAKRRLIGQALRCPACHYETTVPPESVKSPDEGNLYQFTAGGGSATTDDSITIRCGVCGARVVASRGQAGRNVACPDCDSPIAILIPKPAPPVEPLKPTAFEGSSIYGVREEPEQSEAPLAQEASDEGAEDAPPKKTQEPLAIPVVCRLCGTRMHADQSEVGKTKRCPDCGTPNSVPLPVANALKAALTSLSYEGASEFDTAGTHAEFDPEAELVPVICRLCGTRMYAPVSEIGKEKACPDCETKTVVPKSAPVKYRTVLESSGPYGVGRPGATPEPRVGVDYRRLQRNKDARSKPKRSAAALAAEFGADTTRSGGGEGEEPDWDVPKIIHVEPRAKLPKYLYFSRIFRFMRDWQFTFMYCLVTFGLWGSAYLVQSGINLARAASVANWIMALFVLIFGGCATLISFGALALYCMIVVNDTAEAADQVESWPEFDWIGWFLNGLRMVALVVVSAVPGAVIGKYAAGGSIWTLVGSSISVYVFFPYITLSHMATGTLLEPISVPLATTWGRIPGAWLQFYGITFVGFGTLLALPFYLSTFVPWLGVAVLPPLVSFTALMYFRLLGRLGWKCKEELRARKDEDDEDDDDDF